MRIYILNIYEKVLENVQRTHGGIAEGTLGIYLKLLRASLLMLPVGGTFHTDWLSHSEKNPISKMASEGREKGTGILGLQAKALP